MARHGICWTYNNYAESSVTLIKGLVGKCGIKYICFGREVGESGTPHLQGYMQANHDMFARFKKAFEANIHMEKQKGDSKQAKDYCEKDGDFFEAGAYEHIESPKKRQGARKDHDEVKELISQGKSYQEIVDTNFGYAAKYGRFIKEQVSAQMQKNGKASLLAEYEGVSWKPWQQALLDILEEEPCKRKIHWIWEPTGNVGKSWFAKYCALTKSALVLESGKKMDMAYIYAQKPTKIVFVDLSRTTAPVEGKDFLHGMYSLCENLKNGHMMSTKYESVSLLFGVPHVVVFANWEPDYTKWSADRYNVVRID